ncbi:hypothetical protein KIPB_001994 [Kipferlia bialata]|uniref:Glycolipid transfer protein domain-containing protein n=1 Tax=Kipferlia bialata TaxID=797122 RepID=A0A9K3CPQ6_9EUKA|nr:hypothetical protein KIPB_001994 [Kipferlia bialata]|eukprot:g1994.t1
MVILSDPSCITIEDGAGGEKRILAAKAFKRGDVVLQEKPMLLLPNGTGYHDIQSLLKCATEIAGLFGPKGFGITAFRPLSLDVNGNIAKIKEASALHPEATSVEALVLAETKDGTVAPHPKNSATIALLWLRRSIEFAVAFCHGYVDTEKDLPDIAKESYASVLKPYHGMMARGLFKVGLMAVPTEASVEHRILKDGLTKAKVQHDLHSFAQYAEEMVNGLEAFFQEYNLEDTSRA